MPEKPLKPEDIDNIEKALAILKEVRSAIARAQMAGLDVTAQEARAKELETRLLAIKRVYGTP